MHIGCIWFGVQGFILTPYAPCLSWENMAMKEKALDGRIVSGYVTRIE